jgi:hypothetical protein
MKHFAIIVAITLIALGYKVISVDAKQLSYDKYEAYKIMTLLIGDSSISNSKYDLILNNPNLSLNELQKTIFPKDTPIPLPVKETDYIKFTNAVALRESSNDWTVVSKLGYIGLFQFGRLALADCDLVVNVKAFKKDPSIFNKEMQIQTFEEWTKVLYRYTRRHIKRYDGKTINGIKVTTSGIIAGAHLVGHGGVKNWLDSNGTVPVLDGNGICVSEYIKEFSGYDIKDTIQPKKKIVSTKKPINSFVLSMK